MPTLQPGARQFLNLDAGKVLTVSCDSISTAILRSYPAAAGGESTGQTAVAASGSLVRGPYTTTTRWCVEAAGAGVAYSVDVSSTADVVLDASGNASANGSLVSGVEVLSSTGEPSDVLTGDTNPERLASWTLPAGFLGPHDSLVLIAKATNSSSANVKYLSLYLDGTEVAQQQNTTNTNMQVLWVISNRGSQSSQVGSRLNSAGIGVASGALVTSSVDLRSAKELSIRGWTLTSTVETIVLESHTLMVIRGA